VGQFGHFAQILPPEIVVVEASLDTPEATLLVEEARSLGDRAGVKRRREFTVSRYCARRALGELGLFAIPIPSSPSRAPVWPAGIVGSITHCGNYCAAAVGRRAQFDSLGIDAELHRPLPPGTLELVSRQEESESLRGLPQDGTCWDTVLFSAKESVYKAWYPLVGTWLGFHDVAIGFEPGAKKFVARVVATSAASASIPAMFPGRYHVQPGMIATAVAIRRDTG
jgi:4'-phosphopantetheinyl transferase EntD